MTDQDSQGNSAPNYLQRGFGRDPTARRLPRRKDIQSAIKKTPYDSPLWKFNSTGFRTVMEYQIHNLVHRWVNGTMVLMASPNDPVFWLHHCNIDRLWGDWQRAHSTAAAYLPASGATSGHNLNDTLIFNTSPPAPWTGSATPASLVDHHSLGYSYESDPPVPEIAPHVVVAATRTTKTTKLGMVHALPVFPLLSELRIPSTLRRKTRTSTGKHK
jgi:tyrosinase